MTQKGRRRPEREKIPLSCLRESFSKLLLSVKQVLDVEKLKGYISRWLTFPLPATAKRIILRSLLEETFRFSRGKDLIFFKYVTPLTLWPPKFLILTITSKSASSNFVNYYGSISSSPLPDKQISGEIVRMGFLILFWLFTPRPQFSDRSAKHPMFHLSNSHCGKDRTQAATISTSEPEPQPLPALWVPLKWFLNSKECTAVSLSQYSSLLQASYNRRLNSASWTEDSSSEQQDFDFMQPSRALSTKSLKAKF